MGTWGPGNFENDYALDYLDMVQRGLENYVQAILDHRPTSPGDYPQASLDELGESRLVPTVAVMTVLHEALGGCLPRPETVADWGDRYLRVYDAEIDGLGAAPEFKEQRRRVIAETFRRLSELSTAYWQRRGGGRGPS